MKIVFDIGRTKMRIAASHDGVELVSDPVIVETPELFNDGVRVLSEKARELAMSEDIEAVGGGLTGSPQLADWRNKSLASELEGSLHVPVHVENDTAIVGLGEMHRGAGKDYAIGVYMTVSTGVGGAKFDHGVIDEKTYGFEPGHQIIDAGKALCSDCTSPTLEAYVSGGATYKRFGKQPYEIPQSDPLWEQYAEWLAYGVYNTILHWSPEVVVLGGSMIVGDPYIPVDSTRRHVEQLLGKLLPHTPEIKRAELDDVGGLYGALVFVSQQEKQ